jgi:hypothetical protein
MFNDKIWQEIQCYSKLEFPIEDLSKLPKEIRPTRKERNDSSVLSSWERPSLYLIYKIIKCHKLLKQHLPQYKTDGVRNVWIVKPCSAARGFGIYCIDNCIQEFHSTAGTSKGQAKIVQKYIERPLLLNLNNEVRKFDIR